MSFSQLFTQAGHDVQRGTARTQRLTNRYNPLGAGGGASRPTPWQLLLQQRQAETGVAEEGAGEHGVKGGTEQGAGGGKGKDLSSPLSPQENW